MTLPRLLLLTDRSQLPLGRSLSRTITECIAAGATHVVVRELDQTPGARAALADVVVMAGGTPIGAHGPVGSCNAALWPLSALALVHPAHRTQRYKERGASCHSADDVGRAAELGATFATLSPFAETASKPGYGPPVDPGEYDGHPIPVYALGGVNARNAREALNHGAYGVAVMGEVMRADEPGEVVARILAALS